MNWLKSRWCLWFHRGHWKVFDVHRHPRGERDDWINCEKCGQGWVDIVTRIA